MFGVTIKLSLELYELTTDLYFTRDPNFQLTEFIKTLRLELKTWRKFFWQLWGTCHATVCSLCEQPFQVCCKLEFLHKIEA